MSYNFEGVRGILFDYDGTLVDSMPTHYVAWKHVLDKYKIQLDRLEFYKREGSNIYSLMSELTGIEDEEEIRHLVRKKDSLFGDLYKFTPFPGVIEMINDLKLHNIRLGIVTAASKSRFLATTPSQFARNFDCLVTSDDNLKGKPNPDVYLRGLELLNLDPSDVIAIENAPLGVSSALGANLRCLVVGTTLDKSCFPDTISYFDTIVALSKEIMYEK